MNNDLDKLNGLNNQSTETAEPTMTPIEPTPMPTSVAPTMPEAVPAQPMPTYGAPTMPEAAPVQPVSTVEQANNSVNPMAAVENLNKEDAMEEALSHTNQYSPFEAPKQEVNKDVKRTSNKGAYILIGIIFIIMLLFIIFLPQISKLFGW